MVQFRRRSEVSALCAGNRCWRSSQDPKIEEGPYTCWCLVSSHKDLRGWSLAACPNVASFRLYSSINKQSTIVLFLVPHLYRNWRKGSCQATVALQVLLVIVVRVPWSGLVVQNPGESVHTAEAEPEINILSKGNIMSIEGNKRLDSACRTTKFFAITSPLCKCDIEYI